MSGEFDNIMFPGGFFPDGFWPDGFWPKPPEEEAALTVRCQDTATILDEWKETLTVWRLTTVYDASHMNDGSGWVEGESFEGDWQPAGGDTMRREAKLAVKSQAIIIAPCNVDVEENDKIYRADGSFMYVNYVKQYEDHLTIYLKRAEGSQ